LIFFNGNQDLNSPISHDFGIATTVHNAPRPEIPDIDFRFQETPRENPGFSGKTPGSLIRLGFHRLSSR